MARLVLAERRATVTITTFYKHFEEEETVTQLKTKEMSFSTQFL